MATKPKGGKTTKVKTTSLSVAEFIKSPAEAYAKVKAGQKLVLTGKDSENQIVIYPGTLADYAVSD